MGKHLQLLSVLLLLSSQVVFSQEEAPKTVGAVITLEAPEHALPATLIRVKLKGYKPEAGSTIIWDVLNGSKILDDEQVQDMGSSLILTGTTSKDPYRIRVVVVSPTGVSKASAEILIGEAPPVPPIPVDPVDPVVPVDPVNPTPSKIRFLYLQEERDADPKLLAVINSKEVRDYLISHCYLDEQKRPEYRVWDDDYTDDQIVSQGQKWVDAYKKAKADRVAIGKGDNAPWVLISNGTDGESLEPPADTATMLKLLKKWGGN